MAHMVESARGKILVSEGGTLPPDSGFGAWPGNRLRITPIS
jgi:hypothetical protein